MIENLKAIRHGLGSDIIIMHDDGTESTFSTSDLVEIGDIVTIPLEGTDGDTITGVVTEIL